MDQRKNERFPIQRDLRYRLLGKHSHVRQGQGTTVNFSSNGVLFTTDAPPGLGARLELSISWPALLNGACQLKMLATGRVVRLDGHAVAVQIERYEFRTAGRAA